MAERGRTWSERKISVLQSYNYSMTKLAEAGIQRQLLGAIRNVHPFKEIAEGLRAQLQAVPREDQGAVEEVQRDRGPPETQRRQCRR